MVGYVMIINVANFVLSLAVILKIDQYFAKLSM